MELYGRMVAAAGKLNENHLFELQIRGKHASQLLLQGLFAYKTVAKNASVLTKKEKISQLAIGSHSCFHFYHSLKLHWFIALW